MKVVVAWLCLVALALVVANCSIKHASEQYECETNADCAELGDNRVCSEGLCVVPGGNMKDAAVDAPRRDGGLDASMACPTQCTSCNLEKKECVIDCNQNPNNCSNQQMKCPTGFDCTIKCNTPSSCRNGIDCLTAGSCTVECTGSFSCRNVACGPGPCAVSCSGNNACSGISCGQSCACDVKCGQNASCFNVICGKPLCDTGLGCSSEPVTCDTCPP